MTLSRRDTRVRRRQTVVTQLARDTQHGRRRSCRQGSSARPVMRTSQGAKWEVNKMVIADAELASVMTDVWPRGSRLPRQKNTRLGRIHLQKNGDASRHPSWLTVVSTRKHSTPNSRRSRCAARPRPATVPLVKQQVITSIRPTSRRSSKANPNSSNMCANELRGCFATRGRLAIQKSRAPER